jgi:hypothetical protein
VIVGTDQVVRRLGAERHLRIVDPAYLVDDDGALTVEVRTEPGRSGYRTLRTNGRGDTVPAPVPDVPPLEVDALFDGFDGLAIG